MARQLIASLSDEFDADRFEDTYRNQVLDLIERKAAGDTEIVAPPEPMSEDKVVDLMAALEASVKEAKAARKRHPAGAPEAEAARRRPRSAPASPRSRPVAADQVVEVDGRRLKVSNLDKVLYPEAGFTKAEVIDYYVRVAPAMLPHIADRGRHPAPLPERRRRGVVLREALPVAPARSGSAPSRARRPQRHHRLLRARLGRRAGLVGQHGRAGDPRADGARRRHRVAHDVRVRPRPRPGTGIPECAEVALDIREVLDDLAGLECLAKTSGSKGLQLYVPLNTPHTHEHCSEFAQAVAQVLEKHHADAGHVGDEEGAAAGQGLHRLEPEQPPQDDRRGVLAAGPAAADRVDAGDLGRGGGRRRRRAARRSGAPTCSSGWRTDGDLFAATLTVRQELPASAG